MAILSNLLKLHCIASYLALIFIMLLFAAALTCLRQLIVNNDVITLSM